VPQILKNLARISENILQVCVAISLVVEEMRLYCVCELHVLQASRVLRVGHDTGAQAAQEVFLSLIQIVRVKLREVDLNGIFRPTVKRLLYVSQVEITGRNHRFSWATRNRTCSFSSHHPRALSQIYRRTLARHRNRLYVSVHRDRARDCRPDR